MAELAMGEGRQRAPWHLWVVAGLSLLWNVSGAWVIMSAQSGDPMDMDAREIAYYAAQEPWFVALVDLVLVTAVLAAIALLLRSRWAVLLYGLSVAGFVVTATYDTLQRTALFLGDQGWLVLELVTFGLSLAQLLYALWMRGRGVLR